MPRPSRSLFASLPYDLKRNLRTQPTQVLELPVGVDATADLLLDTAGQSGFLLTQPASPTEGEEELSHISISQAGPVAEPLSVAASCKRPLDPEEAPGVAPASFAPFKTSAKRRKGKSNDVLNVHSDHPWDCTGLVPRYQDYSDVPKELAKYFAQRHLLLPRYDTLPLLLDETGWFSITPQPIAAHIAERVQCDVIIDAFCGVGGNAIEFARTCERVIAIDNNPVRLRLARHNALHLGVADRIEFVLGDFVEWAQTWTRRQKRDTPSDTIDVVFLSPPWGGPEYLTFSADAASSSDGPRKYPLSAIEPIPGDELFELTAAITPNIAYFLPRNVDVKEVSQLAKTLPKPLSDGQGGSQRHREWVELEEQWVGDKLKAVTAYYGGLVAE